MTEDLRKALSDSPLLRAAQTSTVDALVGVANLRRIRSDTYLFHQGDTATEVYVLLEGRVEVSSPMAGGERKLHAFLEPPQFFGELGVVGDMPRTATVLAIEDSEVWAIPGEVWKECLAKDPKLAAALMQAMARQFQDHEGLIDDLLFLDLRGRVAKRLLNLIDHDGTGDPITEELTQEDLASLCGGSRENVTRILSELAKRGTVKREGHRYVLLDTDHLRSLAEI